tara:strand:- start:673 stop:1017 length:345 start_codon:yes stop_codon:yes gene_type:complete
MNPIKLSLLVVTFVASLVVDVKAIDKNSDDEFWNEIKQVRENVTGRVDVEFNKKIDYCRWWGESVVKSKKEEWNLSNVVSYSSKCMKHLTDLTNKTLKDVTGTDHHNSHVFNNQ